ncbi:MAG TPA: hypothetical protein VFU29_00820 [Chitinophagaceae bacterium]|nr:hypothetical protein [Chitinophagaceae bacterium]
MEEAHIDMLIARQATVLANAEKKLKQLQTDSIEIQTKITKLQEELTTNSKAQETQIAK